MINDIKPQKGISDFSNDIKEASIRKHFSKPKPLTETLKRTDFLYCDPPEVILQSKITQINYNRCRKEQNL